MLVDGIWPFFMLLGLGESRNRARHHRSDPVSVRLVSLLAQPRRGPRLGRPRGRHLLSVSPRRCRRLLARGPGACRTGCSTSSRIVPTCRSGPASPLVGLGLWYSVPATLAVEFGSVRDRRVAVCVGHAAARPDRHVRVPGVASQRSPCSTWRASSVRRRRRCEVLAMTGIAGWLFVGVGVLDRPASRRGRPDVRAPMAITDSRRR